MSEQHLFSLSLPHTQYTKFIFSRTYPILLFIILGWICLLLSNFKLKTLTVPLSWLLNDSLIFKCVMIDKLLQIKISRKN